VYKINISAVVVKWLEKRKIQNLFWVFVKYK
jgi:hypothetical protein